MQKPIQSSSDRYARQRQHAYDILQTKKANPLDAGFKADFSCLLLFRWLITIAK
ncbi:hypothetical protein [Nostoc sp. C117]|uniref:hypothetical protein n=1 Tax=Nostoc sp. C117 TaxID=3349875 RepID=UPI00370D733B